jgi:glutaminyl-peptide cyclotransferase
MKKLYLITILILLGCSSKSINELNISHSFDGNRAYSYIIEQCDLGPRSPGLEGHQKFEKYLLGFFEKLNMEVRTQNFKYFNFLLNQEMNGKNFYVSLNPEISRRILLGAHWDTRSFADEEIDEAKRKQPVLGANDGASGVAVLMEIANILSNSSTVGVDLVFFDAEDVGIKGESETFAEGSKYFSKNMPLKIKPEKAIIVDMVGDKRLNLPIERYSFQKNKKFVLDLWELAERLGLKAFSKMIKYEIYDDHIPLNDLAQIPAVDIIDFDYPNEFYNYWHTTEDTPDKCSPQSLAQVGVLLLNYIHEN